MPDIPNVPGVPALSSYSIGNFTLLTSDLIGTIVAGLVPGQWGIFLNGVPVLALADNFAAFEFRRDFSVPDYPVELGAFQSYNKVQLPADLRVRVSCGGSEERRQAFLASLDLAMANTFLFDVLTPEKAYLNYNFVHMDFRRDNLHGAGLITVELWLTEIRQSTATLFTTTQQPAEAGTAGLGNVQAQPPAIDLVSTFAGKPAAGGVH